MIDRYPDKMYRLVCTRPSYLRLYGQPALIKFVGTHSFQLGYIVVLTSTIVYPREVVKEALAVNAAAVIVSHNHPFGVAEPGQADERITKRLKSALELVDIRLLDHLIIGDGEAVSLARRGLI